MLATRLTAFGRPIVTMLTSYGHQLERALVLGAAETVEDIEVTLAIAPFLHGSQDYTGIVVT